MFIQRCYIRTWLLLCYLFETHYFHFVSFETFLPFTPSLDRYSSQAFQSDG
ncbi:hypothetical protein ACJX0J_006555, partial [Zea mays]